MRIETRFAMPLLAILAAFLMLTNSASADSFGSWGGGGSWGSTGSNGSWGYASTGSRVFGGHGGPIRNVLARAPLRTMIGRVGSRVGGWGSSGGSWGSGGSHGGSWGSNGSTGYGSYGSNGWASNGNGSWGSSYNYGSNGGSWGTTYVSPASVCNVAPSYGTPVCAHGSYPAMGTGLPAQGQVIDPYYNGGVIHNAPAEGQSVIQGGGVVEPAQSDALSPPVENGGGAPTPGPSDDDTTMNQRFPESMIDVRLPSDAKVYVNGKLTKKTGEYRTFVARHQKPNRNYRYEITAVKDGEKLVQTFTMQAGSNKSIEFDFTPTTVVALRVPENAKVELAGVPTSGNGIERKFTTKKLKKGEAWDDYTVVVTHQRNGKEVVQEKTISVVGGQAYTLNFVDSVDANSVVVKKP